jgi:hypothetical protein
MNIFLKNVLKIESYDYLCTHNYADMVKLVDMPDLGSGAARRVGSSPIIRTKNLSIYFHIYSPRFVLDPDYGSILKPVEEQKLSINIG